MSSIRLTYQNAWHHVMNRAYEGRPIFSTPSIPSKFLSLLSTGSEKYRIRISAWCIMPNHYHLMLQNTSGRMSEFLKYVDSNIAKAFRHKHGGKGVVFQNRFKSSLIDEEHYWESVLCYLLMNPVNAGLAKSPWDYKLSSIHEYFRKHPGICDRKPVLARFPDKPSLTSVLLSTYPVIPVIVKSRPGIIWGDKPFATNVLARFEKRSRNEESKRRRVTEYDFEPVDVVIKEFESINGVFLIRTSFSSFHEKQIRARLLVALKDRCGLTYSRIATLPWFRLLKKSSLGKIYQNEVKRTINT